MDIVFKAKSVDIQALEYLNDHCPSPDLYKGKKYPGFQWAVTLAAEAEKIEWKRYSKMKLDDYFTGDVHNIPPVTHLTCDGEAYANVANYIQQYYQLTKLQNAYCIRCIIKFAVATLKNEGSDTKSENISVLESKLNAIYEGQLLILDKLDTIAELLKELKGRCFMYKFERYALMTQAGATYKKDGKEYLQSVHGKAYTRKDKADEESKKTPIPVETIIGYIDEFLSDWLNPPQNQPRVFKYDTSVCKVDPSKEYSQLEIDYDKNDKIKKYGLKDPMDIVWLKFTKPVNYNKNGYLGVVATGNDINFDIPPDAESYDKKLNNKYVYNSSGILVHHVNMEWDSSFVLMIPLHNIPNGHTRYDIEKAIGNYLIEKEVPIIDFYSHLY